MQLFKKEFHLMPTKDHQPRMSENWVVSVLELVKQDQQSRPVSDDSAPAKQPCVGRSSVTEKMRSYKNHMRYNRDWEIKWSWLMYNECEDGMLCSVCVKYGKPPPHRPQVTRMWRVRPAFAYGNQLTSKRLKNPASSRSAAYSPMRSMQRTHAHVRRRRQAPNFALLHVKEQRIADGQSLGQS